MGRKQRQHTRNIRTKKGRKRVLINKGIKKPKKHVVITAPERRIFNQISDSKVHNVEYGGAIDFQKDGSIERIDVHGGKNAELEFNSDDYEVFYHTHPFKTYYPPSPDDIVALIKDRPQKAEVVFQNGEAFTIIKTAKTKKLANISEKKLMKIFFEKYKGTFGPNWRKDYKKALEDMGFHVIINKARKRPFKINITPVEPRSGKK